MSKRFIFFFAVCVFFTAGPAFAEPLFSLNGQADFAGKKADFNLRLKDGGSVTAELEKVADKKLKFSATIDHVRTPVFDVSSVFQSTIEVVEEPQTGQFYRGVLESKYSLINYKPAQELSGFFEIKKERLTLKNLSWSGFVVDGFVGLVPPYEISLTLRFSEIPAEDLNVITGCKSGESRMEGLVSGRIQISGFSDRLLLSGKLTAFDGAIDNLVYENAVINFDGMYPILQISESSITEDSGLSFNIEGNLDLRSHCNLMTGLIALKMSPIINENVLHREWTIKRSKDSEQRATEFKYRMQKNDDVGGSSQKDSDMLSIEHNIQF